MDNWSDFSDSAAIYASHIFCSKVSYSGKEALSFANRGHLHSPGTAEPLHIDVLNGIPTDFVSKMWVIQAVGEKDSHPWMSVMYEDHNIDLFESILRHIVTSSPGIDKTGFITTNMNQLIDSSLRKVFPTAELYCS